MSIVLVKLHCSNCGVNRTYHTLAEVPRQCPECRRDSRPKYAWLRNKVPFLPALISLGLLFSLGLDDLFVIRAQVLPWLPYVVGSTLFGVVWMLATLLLDWPKPPKGPRIFSVIKWSRQDASPQEVVGLRVAVRLEEHPLKRTLRCNIEGYKLAIMDIEDDNDNDNGGENERLYILRPDRNPLEATHILFHPEWVRFKRGARQRLRKKCGGDFSYQPSVEELLLDQKGPLKEVCGRIYETQNPDTLAASKIPYSLLTVIAYGRLGPRNHKPTKLTGVSHSFHPQSLRATRLCNRRLLSCPRIYRIFQISQAATVFEECEW